MKGDDRSEKKTIIFSTNFSDCRSNDTYIAVVLLDPVSTWIYRKEILISSKWVYVALY